MNCAIHTEVPATAFCRTCGKALCANCQRDVMGAIYCEPCIAVRLQGNVPMQPTPVVPVSIVEGAPSPGLAGVLAGLVPGLGAMYNGEFVKAFVHVVIFASLIMAVSHGYFGAQPLFGILIGFFWFYMIFDAVRSAKAKQLGLPPQTHWVWRICLEARNISLPGSGRRPMLRGQEWERRESDNGTAQDATTVLLAPLS